jgi:hypothetical protein
MADFVNGDGYQKCKENPDKLKRIIEVPEHSMV